MPSIVNFHEHEYIWLMYSVCPVCPPTYLYLPTIIVNIIDKKLEP